MRGRRDGTGVFVPSLFLEDAGAPVSKWEVGTDADAKEETDMAEPERPAVVEDYHGTPVADPFRWLEDLTSPAVQAFVAEQNERTRAYLDGTGLRPAVRARLGELWNFPRYFAPKRKAGRMFYLEHDGMQNQAVYWVQEADGTARVLIDPNPLSEDGTVALMTTAVSPDGARVAYTLSESGSDWQTIRVRRVADGLDDSDEVRWCKFTNIAWHPDGSGFFYTRFPEPGTVAPVEESRHARVCFHRLGTPQSDDPVVYQPSDPELVPHVSVTEDGRYLCLSLTRGTDKRNGFLSRPLAYDAQASQHAGDPAAEAGPGVVRDQGFTVWFPPERAAYDLLGNAGSVFYFITTEDAPKGRVIALDVSTHGQPPWEVVPEGEDALSFGRLVNGALALVYLHNAHHRLVLFSLDGRRLDEPALPAIGSIPAITGGPADGEMFVEFTSYLHPPQVWRYDFASRRLAPYRVPEIPFDPAAYETEQVWFSSSDGTSVPMFLTHRRGLARDGERPVLMYGYGGFNLAQTPQFYPAHLMLLERGGVFAVVSLRGGSEFGEAWHQAGMLDRKQNVFDDFHAAGRWLIDAGYTRPKRLAIMGRSNGGLLVAATMLQRPEQYGAVVCQVPVIDMLRYHRFTVGRFWVPEYGNAEENPDHFRFLYAYSPLHNVRYGRVYPPILITTGDRDDRVAPLHAYKFAATLQAASPGVNPVLLRVDERAGHGLGKPTAKLLDEWADMYTFLFHALAIPVEEGQHTE